METVRKIVRNEYFPAAAVLALVVLFWAVALAGGLSMLNDRNLPIGTLTWMLFVYLIAALTPFAGIVAAVDLVHRYRWNRQEARERAEVGHTPSQPDAETAPEPAPAEVLPAEPAPADQPVPEPATPKQPATQQSTKKPARGQKAA
ncbi:hypothetical protein V1639_08760 [Pseudarthrobacter sp. J75]|uniref:hypothetical protein n=1 Tax=unclassified Pseudarthrobacter TaxID=2647000 RepID=UPI002E82345B|nr:MULTISPECIES: hypothetical protein [unclassified Pseudarthrobacter]MEE2522537.1 hypothetical protein [Pseudarthrobacter sp. J47]MEE2529119.1 hypothetical protein [Pseudarthrobacter sp. J75]